MIVIALGAYSQEIAKSANGLSVKTTFGYYYSGVSSHVMNDLTVATRFDDDEPSDLQNR